MKAPLLVVGCGGHGRVVADVAQVCGYDPIAFLDDSPKRTVDYGEFPILGPISMIDRLCRDWPNAIAAVGNNAIRLTLFERLGQVGFELPTIIHPSATVSRYARLGQGVFVAPGALINTGAEIGNATIVNSGASIDHDCVIGAASHIAPGASLSGDVIVGIRGWIGTGVAIRQGIKICDDVVIGVGAAVVTNITESGTYAGVPARRLSH